MKTIIKILKLSPVLGVALGLFLAACNKELPEENPNNTNSSQLDPVAFSVSPKKQVRFAPGNLNVGGRDFVAAEWYYGGYFCWGTGNMPTNTSLDNADHQEFHDWGEYLFLPDEGWRTMTAGEWNYLLEHRVDAEFKRGTAIVIGVHGLILLPDGWTEPDGLQFSPGCISWRDNVYNQDQWVKMKAAGAVFLPASDYIYEGNIVDGHVYDSGPHVGDAGYYWTSSASGNPNKAQCMCFYDGRVYPSVEQQRCFRQSVRLVRDVK